MENVDVELGEVDNIRDTVHVLLGCVQKVQNGKVQFSPIYMAPTRLRNLSPNSFNPRVVSIGPLHKEDKSLQITEGEKYTYLHDLVSRLDSPPEQTLKACAQKVNASIDRIRACYNGMKTYSDVDLSKIMVMDGCFILEFIFKLFRYGTSITYNLLFVRSVALDLVLIENQMPFFVLQDIFECTILKMDPEASLTTMLSYLLEYINPFSGNFNIENIGQETTHDHILGLLHKLYLPSHPKPSNVSSLPIAHSALELYRAGVKFQPNRNMTWPLAMDLKFCTYSVFSLFGAKPNLSIPVICINDVTEVVLRNLIVYEQYTPVYNYVTSYAMAMNMLVDTPVDICKLVESKVVINHLGSNEKAAKMMNTICKEVTFQDFYYTEQWENMDRYYNGYFPRNLAKLKRYYFSGPWHAVVVVGGILMFAITVVQTIFTIKPI
ncbi:unnamed protein product [Lactuca saligna]|uniref:Uncharacterized protein n=1 Tax=Lactuca saligna TaxID=75948 RepID=A0AA36EIY7_LACSI|nr:unnamed protein product [Lactuca saligna]